MASTRRELEKIRELKRRAEVASKEAERDGYEVDAVYWMNKANQYEEQLQHVRDRDDDEDVFRRRRYR